MIDFDLDSIEDLYQRENFRKLDDSYSKNPFLKGDWYHREYTFTQAETSKKVPHGLSFMPKDILVTYVSAGTITINYASIDATNLNITSSAACTFRLLIGRVTA